MLSLICFVLFFSHALGMETLTEDNAFARSYLCSFESFEVSDEAEGHCKTVRMKIIYPNISGTPIMDPRRSPHPVVIFFGGALMESNRYQWLAGRLVKECGIIFVTTEVVALHHGRPMLLPLVGGRKKPKSPNPYLTKLFEKLKELNEHGMYAGRLNLDKVVVGGHSWGGRVALIDAANDKFFPNVVGAFIYAAHALIFPEPGFIPGSAMSLEGRTPLLLMIGSRDARIMSTGPQFLTVFTSPAQPVLRTFRKSFAHDRRCYFVELDGFNHMSPVYPEDDAIPTWMFDGLAKHKKETMMEELFRIISLFVKEHALGDHRAGRKLERRLFRGTNPFVRQAVKRGPPPHESEQ